MTIARQQALGDLPRRSSERLPGKVAIIDGDVRVTFKHFGEAIDRVCHGMADRGLARGDRCAVLSRNSWEFAVLAFATARLGVLLVPVNFMLTAGEIAFVLEHSGASALVVGPGAGRRRDRRRRPAAADIHQWRRVASERCDADEPFAPLAVRHLRDRREYGGRRRRAPLRPPPSPTSAT